mgnify:CR=1 FL=1
MMVDTRINRRTFRFAVAAMETLGPNVALVGTTGYTLPGFRAPLAVGSFLQPVFYTQPWNHMEVPDVACDYSQPAGQRNSSDT